MMSMKSLEDYVSFDAASDETLERKLAKATAESYLLGAFFKSMLAQVVELRNKLAVKYASLDSSVKIRVQRLSYRFEFTSKFPRGL